MLMKERLLKPKGLDSRGLQGKRVGDLKMGGEVRGGLKML